MDIQDLGAIGEFISSVAIVITLIFFTMETRRARTATQQSNRQARHRIRTDLALAIAGNPQLSEVFVRSGQHLSGTDRPRFDLESVFGVSDAESLQLFNYAIAMLRHLEDQYFSDLPESDRAGLEAQTRVILNFSPFLALWELSKSGFDNRFQEYVDNLMQEGQGEDQS